MGSMRALNKPADFEAFNDWNSSNHYDLSKLTVKALAAIRELDALFKLEKDPAQNSVPRTTHRSSLVEGDGQFPLNEIGAVLKRAWWGRIWVVQELALAKDISFVCGYNVIPGKCIRSFLNIWDSLNRGFIPWMLDHRPWALFEIRDSVQTGSPLPIKDILLHGYRTGLANQDKSLCSRRAVLKLRGDDLRSALGRELNLQPPSSIRSPQDSQSLG
jgi:hypothetical protein